MLALLATWERIGPPETDVVHPDYLLINKILLEEVPAQGSRSAARVRSRIDGLAFRLDEPGRRMLVLASRGHAWEQALRLWTLRHEQHRLAQAVLMMDRAAAYHGELILLEYTTGDESLLRRARGGLNRVTDFVIGPRHAGDPPA